MKISTIDPHGNMKSIDFAQYGGLDNFLLVSAGNGTVNNYAALRALVPWMQKGVVMSSNAVAQMPYAILDAAGNEIDKERAWGAIKDPQRVIQLVAASLCAGAGYVRYKATSRAVITWQYLLPTSIVEVRYDDNGVPVSFKRQLPNGKAETIPVEEMLYFWLPDDTIETGPAQICPLKNAALASGMLAAMDSTLSDYGKRGFIPPMFAVAEGVQPSERERVENKLSAFVRGSWRTLVMLVNGQKLIPQPVGVTMDGLRGSYIQIYRQQIENIAAAFGMPLSMMLSNAANYATAQSDRMTWYETGVFVSLYQCVQDTLTDQLFARYGWRMEYRPQEMDAFKQDESGDASAVATLAGAIANSPEAALVAMDILGYELTEEQEQEIEEMTEPEPEPEPTPAPPMMEGEPPAVDEELDAEEEAMSAALRKWERFEIANFGKGKQFEPQRAGVQIPERLQYNIRAELGAVKSADEIPAVFVRAAKDVPALLLARELRKLAK